MSDSQGALTLRTSGGADELFELLTWLNDDDELRGRVKLSESRIRPEEMGGLAEVLVVTLGAGGTMTALASSLSTWFTVRGSDITVTRGKHGEFTFVLKRGGASEAAQILQQLLDQPTDQQ